MGLLDGYRTNWPRVGAAKAMAGAGLLVLTHRRMSKPRLFAALNFLALLVHQYEESEDPGYFPGQFNGGILHSDTPDRYPLDTNTAMIINTAIAYPFYVLPVLFPKKRWLGIAPVLFGFGQAVGHGIVFPRLAKARYSPGFLASLFLHVPIGIAYLRALKEEAPIEPPDWKKARLYTVGFAASGVGAPNLLLRDKNSPYAFTAKQVGRYNPR
jgi:Protein of unknown function with HXXEE motif